jgi:hypothetical protein
MSLLVDFGQTPWRFLIGSTLVEVTLAIPAHKFPQAPEQTAADILNT